MNPITIRSTKDDYFVNETPPPLFQTYLACAKLVGESLIMKKNDSLLTPVTIHKCKVTKISIFYIMSNQEKEILGYMDIDPTKIAVTTLKSYSHKTYLGIGKKLMQVAIERAFKKEENLTLNAADNSHGFYNKIGLKAIDKEHNKIIKQECKFAESEGRMPNTKQYFPYAIPMQLSEKGKQTWRKIIQETPVLNK